MTKPPFTRLLTVLPGGGASPDYINDVFGVGGYLSRQVTGYKPRPGQIELARAIDKGICEGRHVIGEGPTGTGKSLAYSVPAAYHAVHNKKRVLIVTANKTLQAQIVNKDLKDLLMAVPWHFTYAVRKGISSYLCARDLRDKKWRQVEDEDRDMVADTVEWAEETLTGDFEESPGPPPKIWAEFSTTNDECDGPKNCRSKSDCFVIKAKDAAAKADIVVTNYHLLFRHLNHMASGRPGSVLPPFDIAILDEAHNAANIARDFLGEDATVGFNSVYRCVSNLHMAEVSSLRFRCTEARHTVLDESRRFWAELSARARANNRIFDQPGDCKSEHLEEVLTGAKHVYLALAESLGATTPLRGGKSSTSRAAAAAGHLISAERCQKVIDKLAAFRTQKINGLVYYIEGSGSEDKGGTVKLRSKALRVGRFMRESLFQTTPTVIQTSATLAVKGGGPSDFDYLKREMGMKELPNVDELTVESPFNWPKQALLVIPKDMPLYKFENGGSDEFDAAVQERFEEIVRIVQGRTMGLFTSYKLMEKVRDSLRRAALPYEVLVQREATNRELQQKFKRDISSVLLGTQSFAEGVDIQGEACTCVVLDKFNFTPEGDPVLVGLRKSDPNVFQHYQLPEAIISFKQRLGRLIRSINDVGIVVVLDRRLLTKGYGKQFIQSIPPLQIAHDLTAIAPFLRSVGAL
jgi:ATP-dependent DNA helicase DinG